MPTLRRGSVVRPPQGKRAVRYRDGCDGQGPEANPERQGRETEEVVDAPQPRLCGSAGDYSPCTRYPTALRARLLIAGVSCSTKFSPLSDNVQCGSDIDSTAGVLQCLPCKINFLDF